MDLKKIFIIDDLGDVCKFIKSLFKNDSSIKVICTNSEPNNLLKNFKTDFNLIIINKDGIKHDLKELTGFVKEHLFYLIIPVVVFTSNKEDIYKQNELLLPIITYYPKPLNKKKILTNIKHILGTFDYNLNINDISGLPCCAIIDRKITYELIEKSEFSFIFLDLDNFKDYNEYYGLKRGNDVILFFSNLLQNIIAEIGTIDDFIGHVGGDDFVMILKDYRHSEKICKEVIHRFESGIRDYYDKKDLKNKYIEITDREGNLKKFPIMGISISVIKYNEFENKTFDDAYKEIMELKKEVKKIDGSAFLIKE